MDELIIIYQNNFTIEIGAFLNYHNLKNPLVPGQKLPKFDY